MNAVAELQHQMAYSMQPEDYRAACLARAEWLVSGRGDQMPPDMADEEWFTWLMMAGRGSGKTRAGAEHVWWWAFCMPGSRWAVVAPTSNDARKTCFEGESGLIARIPKQLLQNWNRGELTLTMTNGSIMQGYSAEEPDRLRGPQHHGAWCDELAAWQYLDATLDNLLMGLRLGKAPRVVATTTPRPIKRIKEIVADKTSRVDTVSTYANIANLPKIFVDVILKRYEGTRLGEQELQAKLLGDMPGALWNRTSVDADRAVYDPVKRIIVRKDGRIVQLARVVTAVDPASGGLGQDSVTDEKGDEVGIVVCALGDDGEGYCLADRSVGGKPTPDEWGKAAIRAHDEFMCDGIVYEANQGGEMVRHTLVTSAKSLREEKEREYDFVSTEAVWASRGKVTRAEPISALSEQHRIHHCGSMSLLEDQMFEFTTNFDKKKMGYSPDRVDAYVWGFTNLMLNDDAGLNIQDHYRKEHNLHQEAMAARSGVFSMRDVTDEDGLVALVPPNGQTHATGMMGNMYSVKADGFMYVHKDDVNPLIIGGYKRAYEQVANAS